MSDTRRQGWAGVSIVVWLGGSWKFFSRNLETSDIIFRVEEFYNALLDVFWGKIAYT